MDYEQKYKEALERARDMLSYKEVRREDMEYIFPELKESKDEKIRKAIYNALKYLETVQSWDFLDIDISDAYAWLEKQGEQIDIANKEYWRGYREGKKEILDKYAELEKQDKQNTNILWHDVSDEPEERREIFCEWSAHDDVCQGAVLHDVVFYHADTKIFWDGEQQIERVVRWAYVDEMLEKQGEQKLVDKVEPKFKVGDWIISHYNHVAHIKAIDEKNYFLSCDNGSCERLSIEYIDRNWHLWTIKDAKKGDVLANDHNILILKESVYDWYTNGTPYSVKAYCGIKPNGNFEIGIDNWSFCGTLHIHPATKEQRDLLFIKMKEEGYEWNKDKKKLIKL